MTSDFGFEAHCYISINVLQVEIILFSSPCFQGDLSSNMLDTTKQQNPLFYSYIYTMKRYLLNSVKKNTLFDEMLSPDLAHGLNISHWSW